MARKDDEQHNEWVETVMNSACNKKALPHDPHFYDKVQARLRTSKPQQGIHLGRYAKQAAAAAVVLFALNIASITRATKSPTVEQKGDVITLLQQDFENLSTY